MSSPREAPAASLPQVDAVAGAILDMAAQVHLLQTMVNNLVGSVREVAIAVVELAAGEVAADKVRQEAEVDDPPDA